MKPISLAGSFLLSAAVAVSNPLQAPTQETPTPATDVEHAPVIEVAPVPEAPVGPAIVGRAIDLAICLDTSGSMDGLLGAAKQKIWAIVNDLALVQPLPVLRVALYSFGNDGDDPARGWVRRLVPLTEDLDLVSRELFALTTNGGTELVGRVVNSAATELQWTPGSGALKLIVVAGNESADQDQEVRYADACRAAIGRDIIVNAIYCGNPADELASAWRDVALLADGQFASIDHNMPAFTVVTPFDDQLAALSSSINGTYIRYGALGRAAGENQWAQDENAAGQSSQAVAERAACKAGVLYRNFHWDLVDGCANGAVDILTLPVEELPEVMRAMTPEQRREYVAKKAGEREVIQGQVVELTAQRQQFIEAEMRRQGLDGSRGFDAAIRSAIRTQAAACGFRFPAVEEPPVESPAALPGAGIPATVIVPQTGSGQAASGTGATGQGANGQTVNGQAANGQAASGQAPTGRSATPPVASGAPAVQRIQPVPLPPEAADPQPAPTVRTEEAPVESGGGR
ncbi:MAG TPA: hypothetical protein QF764_02600 [Planctomycetota bacterium]|jgi:hypothetical protein|nr:hypothetical protein [Planctomycetota bacterium]